MIKEHTSVITGLPEMSRQSDIAEDTHEYVHSSEIQRIFKVFVGRKLAMIGSFIVMSFFLIAVFAPYIAPYDPYEVDLSQKLLEPNIAHPLGTDSVGRDTLSRIIYGSRISLIIGILAVGIAAIFGQLIGLIAAYFGGAVLMIFMRFIDALMAIPVILNALLIASVLGGGMKNVIIALSISMIPTQARLMCGQALSIKQNDYVTAGRAAGASNMRMMLRHILPNCFPPLIVLMTIDLGMCILAEAGLSFLGIGIVPPTPAWGSMVSEGYRYLHILPILSFAPGFTIMGVVFSFNMVGDGLRDALDPRLRGTL